MVTLDPTTHTYSDSDDVTYQSVTRFINKFVPQFDFENKSKQYASKYGLDVQDVRDSWKQKNKQSTDFGTLIHENVEHRLRHKQLPANCMEPSVIEDIASQLESEFAAGEFLLEQIVWDKTHMMAGTSDVIIDNANTFSIVDFKTNKQIKYSNDYEDKFLLKPVHHLPNGEYFKYALQLSFYAYMYGKKTNKTLDRLSFFWLKRKNNSYDNLKDSKWVRYNVPYLKDEVLDMLYHDKQN